MAITTAEALRHMINGQTRHLATLRLELGQASDLEGLTLEIEKLRSARNVVIGSEEVLTDMSEPNWTSPQATQLFTALGKLRGVEEIQLQDLGITFGPQGPRFPVALLTKLLQPPGTRGGLASAAAAASPDEDEEDESHKQRRQQQQQQQCRPSLKRLVLGVRLVGDGNEFQQLATCLRLQKSLRRVTWEEWCFPMTDEGNDQAYFDFNPIVSAIATLPKLNSLSIKAMTAGSRRANLGPLGTDPLIQLCQSSTLRQLQLVHFQLDSKTVRAAAHVLRTNDTLELLSLDLSKTGSRGALYLFDMLRYNRKLTEFQVWASTQPSWAKDYCLIHLAKALTVNASIKSLAVVTHSRTLAEAMQNLTVVNDRIARAFVQTMETNCTLESVVLDDYGEEHRQKQRGGGGGGGGAGSGGQQQQQQSSLMSIMLFYLALNCSKRRQQLLQKYDTYTRKDWMELLAMAIKSDREIRLEAIYYFLRLNPSLCQLA